MSPEKQKIRSEIQTMVAETMTRLDPSGDNTKRWNDFFASLDDKGFEKFMHLLSEKKVAINILAPNMKKVLKIADILNAAKYIGHATSHRLWMPDMTRPGVRYLTPEKYLVLDIPIRRAFQSIEKKMSVPSRDRKIDALTGQVTAEDKACAISAPEIQALHVRGLHNTLSELVRVRGGDVNAYGDFNRQLQENGSASLASLDNNTRARSATIARILLQGMGIDNNM